MVWFSTVQYNAEKPTQPHCGVPAAYLDVKGSVQLSRRRQEAATAVDEVEQRIT